MWQELAMEYMFVLLNDVSIFLGSIHNDLQDISVIFIFD